MSRKSRNDHAAPRSRQTSSAQRPAPRAAAGLAPGADAAPVFPFARTAEDDELRDLSGYGWGV
jgi:hypothetical protein